MAGKKKLIVDIDANLFDRWDNVIKKENLTRTEAISESMVAQWVSYALRQQNKEFTVRAREFLDEQIQESRVNAENGSSGKQIIERPIARTPSQTIRKSKGVRPGVC